jgi:apolipoprotein N-acyltransferase
MIGKIVVFFKEFLHLAVQKLKKSTLRERMYGGLAIIIFAIELFLLFSGPLALYDKPSILVSRIFAYNLDEEDEAALDAFLVDLLVETNSFRLVPQQSLIEYAEAKEQTARESGESFTQLEKWNWQEFGDAARDLGTAYYAIPHLYKSTNHVTFSITVRESREDARYLYGSFKSDSFENLYKGIGVGGAAIDFMEKLKPDSLASSIFDYFFSAFLWLQLLLALMILFSTHRRLYIEILLSLGIILFAFSMMYALNANMDYTQRFVATSGQIRLAENTFQEQMFAVIRFLPFILCNSWLLFFFGNTRGQFVGKRGKEALDVFLRFFRIPLALTASLLFAFSFPSLLHEWGIPVFAWIGLSLLFLQMRAGKAILPAIVFGVIQAIIINFWHATFNYVSLPFTALITGLQYIPFVVLLAWSLRKERYLYTFLTAAVWLSFDYLRSIGYLGYPWGFPAVSQYAVLPLIQISDIFGVWGVSFVIVQTAAVLSLFIYRWNFSLSEIKIRSLWLLPLLVSFVYGGIWMLSYRVPEQKIPTLLVQQNTDPRKHLFKDTFETLQSLSRSGLNRYPETEMLVWPEGAFSENLRKWSENPNELFSYTRRVKELQEFIIQEKVHLITGTRDSESEELEDGSTERRSYNSSGLMSKSGELMGIYRKINLVPFSEYFPFGESMPWLEDLLEKFNISHWTPGEEYSLLSVDGVDYLTPICFEDVFPGLVREFVVRGGDVIVVVSNDYWSLSPIEGIQHGTAALFRAVENRRSLVRSTTSGLTLAVDPLGRFISPSPETYTASFQFAQVPVESFTSIYTRFGDWFPLLMVLLTFSLLSIEVYLFIKEMIRSLNARTPKG